jgi:hypothetical protein
MCQAPFIGTKIEQELLKHEQRCAKNVGKNSAVESVAVSSCMNLIYELILELYI